MKNTSATVLNIISAKVDAEILKMLLSRAGEKFPHQRWTFVPTGIHLIDSVDIVKSALRTQNEYCHSITSVPIEGIPEHTMLTGGINGAHMEVSLKTSCTGLQSIERTNQLHSRGKWHFIVKKAHADKLRHYVLNTVIPDLENNGLPIINGIVAGVAGSLMGTTTVGNYAEVLKRNLTKDSVDFTKANLNQIPVRKRQHVIPTYAREETARSTPDIPRVINGTITPVTTAKTMTDTNNINWDTKIDAKIKVILKDFDTKQEIKL